MNVYIFIFICPLQPDRHTIGQKIIQLMLIDQKYLHIRKQTFILNSTREIIFFLYFYIFALCSLMDRPTDKIFTKQMLIDAMNLHRRNKNSILNRERISPFPQKPDRRLYRQTEIRTDISSFRVALLKICFVEISFAFRMVIKYGIVFSSEATL